MLLNRDIYNMSVPVPQYIINNDRVVFIASRVDAVIADMAAIGGRRSLHEVTAHICC